MTFTAAALHTNFWCCCCFYLRDSFVFDEKRKEFFLEVIVFSSSFSFIAHIINENTNEMRTKACMRKWNIIMLVITDVSLQRQNDRKIGTSTPVITAADDVCQYTGDIHCPLLSLSNLCRCKTNFLIVIIKLAVIKAIYFTVFIMLSS